MGQRYAAKARSFAQHAGRQLDTSQQVALPQHILMIAGDKILDCHLTRAAIASQDIADALERNGQRNHRTGGQ